MFKLMGKKILQFYAKKLCLSKHMLDRFTVDLTEMDPQKRGIRLN